MQYLYLKVSLDDAYDIFEKGQLKTQGIEFSKNDIEADKNFRKYKKATDSGEAILVCQVPDQDVKITYTVTKATYTVTTPILLRNQLVNFYGHTYFKDLK